ncbi:MAG TPA: ABC transporter substrate-binding protein [Caldilineaceae bacterium]|nr:ABC transporter substrate-binding protein [Caldilineaceae bacterium]
MKRLHLFVLLTLLASLTLTACATATAPTQSDSAADTVTTASSGEQTGTIVIRNMGNLTSWNPTLTSDGASLQARNLLWPALINTDETTGEPVPGLQTWEVSDDTLTYTFHIRDDATWSDGTPISSTDVKFIIDAIQSDIETVFETAVEQIVAVNIIDEKSYEVVLDENNCAFLPSFGAIRLLPAHKYAADFSDFESSDFNMNPDISGGPYILEEWAPTEFEAYTANPDYWGGAPAIPNLVNRVMEDSATGVQALQAGEVDYMTMQGDLFQQISNLDGLEYSSFPQTSVGFLALNWSDPDNPQPAYDANGNLVEQTPHPLFSDVRVRKAVAMGINVQDLIDAMGPDGGTQLVGAVSPISWAYNDELSPYPYDPEGAQALLEEAGWVDSDGDGVREKDGEPLAFTISYSSILQMFETETLLIQDQLNQIGFDVSVQHYEWANYLEEVLYGQGFDATPMTNSDGAAAEPDTFTSLILSRQDVPGTGNNFTSYINPEIDELIDQARSVDGCDQAERAELYKQIQEIAHEDVSYVWLFVPNMFHVSNSRIGGFEPGATWVYYGYLDHPQEWFIKD